MGVTVAQVPECVLKTRLAVGDLGDLSPAQLPDEKIIELLDEMPKCPDAFDHQFGKQIQGEHLFRQSHSPSYRAAYQRHEAKLQASFEQPALAAPRYDVFDVNQHYSLPLPEGGFLSKWFDRMDGDQCVQIIDANRNHTPDDGDTCVGRNGDLYPEAKFVGAPMWTSPGGKTCGNLTQFQAFAGTADACAMIYQPQRDDALFAQNAGTTFEVHRPSGAESFAMELADSSASYGARMKDQANGVAEGIVGSAEEHPVAAGAIVTVIGGLLAHPVTRGPTAAVLEWLGIGGAVIGTGGIVYDGAAGMTQYAQDRNVDALSENMSGRHVQWLLLMSGGLMRGVTIPQAVAKFVTGPERAAATLAASGRQALAAGDELAAWLFGGGGGFGPQLAFEGVGIGGGGIAIGASGAIEVGAVAEAGDVFATGGGFLPTAPLGPLAIFRISEGGVSGGGETGAVPRSQPLNRKLAAAPRLRNKKLERDLTNPRFRNLSDEPSTLDYFLRNPDELLGAVPQEGDEVLLIFAMDSTGEIRVGVSSPFVVHHSSLFGPTQEVVAAGEMEVVFQRTAWGKLMGHVKKVDAMSGHFLPNPERTLPLVEDVLRGWKTPLSPDFTVDMLLAL